jgi:hypothetical protein
MIQNNKFLQIDGEPIGGKQKVKQSTFNDELNSWEQRIQTGNQSLTLGVFTDITCDGGKKSVIRPSSANPIWNISTSQGTLLAGGWYTIRLKIVFTASVNNMSLTLRLINVDDPLDFEDRELFLERSGVPVTLSEVFEFDSEGSVFKIQANPEANATVSSIEVLAKREY